MAKTKEKIAEQRTNQRKQFWPAIDDRKDLWRANKNRPGYRTIPRTLPLILRLMDKAADEKVSGAYLDLWTQSYDEFLVRIYSEEDRAFYSGYGHARTWRDRIRRLEELGFILTAAHANRTYGFILLLNPHKVIPWLAAKQPDLVDTAIYNTIQARAIESGIVDFKLGWDHPRDRKPPEVDDEEEDVTEMLS
jgi:hypothetical protein